MSAQHPPFYFFLLHPNDINNTANDVWILPLQQQQQQRQQHWHYSLPQCYYTFAVSISWGWLVINVFMLLQRLIYGYISLVVLLLLYSYYFAIFASCTYFRRCILIITIVIVAFGMHKTGTTKTDFCYAAIHRKKNFSCTFSLPSLSRVHSYASFTICTVSY